MTKRLQEAFAAAATLPDGLQDELAEAILEEVAAEDRWEQSLASNPSALERLADEALDDHKAGRSEPWPK